MIDHIWVVHSYSEGYPTLPRAAYATIDDLKADYEDYEWRQANDHCWVTTDEDGVAIDAVKVYLHGDIFTEDDTRTAYVFAWIDAFALHRDKREDTPELVAARQAHIARLNRPTP